MFTLISRPMTLLHRLKTSSTAGLWAGALALSALVSGCGSGSTFEPLVAARVISFGDGLSDLGQASGARYTVNDGTVNIWVQRVAANYGLSISASSAGGLGFARGLTRVNTGANSTADQITAFLGANTIGGKDLLIVDAGVTELYELALANPVDADLDTAADTAGRALGAQVLRLTAAGGKQVVIANAPDLGKTPYAKSASRTTALTAATRKFNDGLKLSLANVTGNVLLIDNEAYVNALHTTPSTLGTGGDVNSVACPGVVTACTNANANASYGVFLYADQLHLTPRAHVLMGDSAYDKIKARW
jgi:outer membrane lipase/esterase